MKLGTIRTAETTTKTSSTTGLHTCMCFSSLLVLGLSHMRLMTWSLMSSVDILGTNCDQCVCMVQCCIRLIRTGSPGRPLRLPHSSLALTHATSYRAKFIRKSCDINIQRTVGPGAMASRKCDPQRTITTDLYIRVHDNNTNT